MTLIRRDRVVETTTSTGTGDLTLAGAVAGYRRFSSVMSVGDTCYVGVEAIGSSGLPTGDWEIGLYTYSAANTLTRTTIHASSNSDAAVGFAAGTKRVMMGLTVADFATRMQQASYRGTYTTASAGYSWDFEDGVVPGTFTQTDALAVVSDTDGSVTQNSLTFAGGPVTANFATKSFSFGIVADASHTSLTIRAKIQCNYATGGAWEGVRFYVDGVDQGQLSQSVSAETTYTDHVITGLSAGAHTIRVDFHTSAYGDVGFQNVRIASITNGVATSTPYRYGDIVDYGAPSVRYMCLIAGTGALPTVTTDWAPVNSAVLNTAQVSARYWGLFDIEPQPDQQLVIAEVGFRLAAGGAASAPSAIDGSNAGTPANVAPGTAGNWDTYVSTSGYRAPHWLSCDFGAAIAPVEFYVDSRSDFAGGAAQAPRTLQLAYSSDGINWTPHSRYTMNFTAISQRIALTINGVASFGAISPTAISPTYTLRGATDYDNTTAPSANQVIAWNNSLGKYKPTTMTLSFCSDVDFATAAPTDKQLLRYNNATGKWVPQTITLSYASDVDVTTAAPTDGQALVYNNATGKWSPGTVAASSSPSFVTPAQASAQYWRLRFLALRADNSTTAASGLGELTFKDAAGTTLTTGGTAIASSSQGTNTPDKAFDGVVANAWYTANGKNIGEWIGYNFGSAKTPASVVVSADPGFVSGMPLDFAIDYSSDGTRWTLHSEFRSAAWVANAAQTFALPSIAAAAQGVSNALVKLAQQTLTAASASIDFTGIPQGYEDLVIVINGQLSGSADFVVVRANGDATSGNYQYARGVFQNSGLSYTSAVATGFVIGLMGGAAAGASYADMVEATIQSYARTSFFKNARSRATLRSSTAASGMTIEELVSDWLSTAAINRLTFIPNSGNFTAGTTITIYGRGGAIQTASGNGIAVLGETILTAVGPNLTVSNIPSGYRDLIVSVQARGAGAGGYTYLRMNGDASALYDQVNMDDFGSGIGNSSSTAQTQIQIGQVPGITSANYSAGQIGNHELIIPGYTRSFRKQVTNTWSASLGSFNGVGVYAGEWRNTAAITSLTLFMASSQNFDVGSVMTIYGRG